jgi:hypothetical protein
MRVLEVDIMQPIYEQVRGDLEVQDRLQTLFMLNLELNDTNLQDFGQ